MFRTTLSVVCCIACLATPVTAAPNQKNWLITPDEVKSLTDGGVDATPRDTRGRKTDNAIAFDMLADSGPQLEVVEPRSNLVHSPISMRVRFIPKTNPVNLASLEVHAQKWVLGAYHGNLDISPRVRKFVVQDGIDMQNQDLPKGRYRLTLDIKDTKGAQTEAVMNLDVQ